MKRPSAPTLALAILAATTSANPQLPDSSSSRGSGSMSRTCARILRQPVSGCSDAEFATGSCSRACADGLESTQASLQEACDGVRGGPAFLDAALNDRLVDVACRQGVEEDEDEDDDEDESPTTTGERERDVPETDAPTPTAESGGGGNEPPTPDAQPTQPAGRTEERSGGDEGRPNGAGGSPFDIVAGGGAALRAEAGWMALGLGVLFLAR